MKKIKLSCHELYAIVDDDDFVRLSKYTWFLKKEKNVMYALRHGKVFGKNTTIRMHREVIGIVRKRSVLVDHKNRNGLDNRKKNLRLANRAENGRNSRPKKADHKGVYFLYGAWNVLIWFDGRQNYFGRYSNKKDAIRVARREYRKRFGDIPLT